MQITRLSIQNYKSLKDITLSLRQLSLIVGSNASGKSNLSDCIDFISEVYRHGLEVAVGRKGGYENIAFRRTRRSKQPISISLTVEFDENDSRKIYRQRKSTTPLQLRLEHSFSFVARGYSIQADFHIVSESVEISVHRNDEWLSLVKLARNKDNKIVMQGGMESDKRIKEIIVSDDILKEIVRLPDQAYWKQIESRSLLASTGLLIDFVGRFGLYIFRDALEGIRVFQLSPTKSRESGVPTPRPELDKTGANLPAVVNSMKKRNSKEWELVLKTMRKILPDLESIDIIYTSSRTLGLVFKEKGVGRPWAGDEVSDGTIQTLGLLVALFNPASKVLVIEEPENSVHPWIIRLILDACREAARQKQIIITSHSPIVINTIKPEDVWIIWRANGETHIKELSKLDQGFLSMWEHGEIPTFEYLDSGTLTEAIPPSPSISNEAMESQQ